MELVELGEPVVLDDLGVVVEVEVDDEVVVDDSWATAALAGTRNTLTSAPATSARAGSMTVYRLDRSRC